MQMAPGAQLRRCPAAEVPSNAQGLQGFLPGLTSASGTSGPRGTGGVGPAGAPMVWGVGGAQKTRPPSGSLPGAAPGPAALGAPKVPGLASPGAAALSSHPRWRDATSHLHLRLISNKEESTKSWKNNLSLVSKRATTYSIQIKAQWKYLNI